MHLRNNNTKNAAVREMHEPAPTPYFGQRMNYCAWEGCDVSSGYAMMGAPDSEEGA